MSPTAHLTAKTAQVPVHIHIHVRILVHIPIQCFPSHESGSRETKNTAHLVIPGFARRVWAGPPRGLDGSVGGGVGRGVLNIKHLTFSTVSCVGR